MIGVILWLGELAVQVVFDFFLLLSGTLGAWNAYKHIGYQFSQHEMNRLGIELLQAVVGLGLGGVVGLQNRCRRYARPFFKLRHYRPLSHLDRATSSAHGNMDGARPRFLPGS